MLSKFFAMQKSGTAIQLEKREYKWKLSLRIHSRKNMKTNTLQVLAIAFVFGWVSLNSLLNGPSEDSPYYQDKSDLLQCTVNIDCDNNYDWGILFPSGEVSGYMNSLEYPEELKYHDDPRCKNSVATEMDVAYLLFK